jgi:hypothetical protein
MCGVIDPASRVRQDKFVCTACGHTEHADTNAACNIEQARMLAVEPPKRIRRRRMRFNSGPGMAMGLARRPENLSAGGRGRRPRFQAGEHVTPSTGSWRTRLPPSWFRSRQRCLGATARSCSVIPTELGQFLHAGQPGGDQEVRQTGLRQISDPVVGPVAPASSGHG